MSLHLNILRTISVQQYYVKITMNFSNGAHQLLTHQAHSTVWRLLRRDELWRRGLCPPTFNNKQIIVLDDVWRPRSNDSRLSGIICRLNTVCGIAWPVAPTEGMPVKGIAQFCLANIISSKSQRRINAHINQYVTPICYTINVHTNLTL